MEFETLSFHFLSSSLYITVKERSSESTTVASYLMPCWSVSPS